MDVTDPSLCKRNKKPCARGPRKVTGLAQEASARGQELTESSVRRCGLLFGDACRTLVF